MEHVADRFGRELKQTKDLAEKQEESRDLHDNRKKKLKIRSSTYAPIHALPLVQGLAQCTKRLNGPKIARKFCKRRKKVKTKSKDNL